MVTTALRNLTSELTYATGGTDEKTEAMIDEALDESHHSQVLAGL
jgi:hypothetical protein